MMQLDSVKMVKRYNSYDIFFETFLLTVIIRTPECQSFLLAKV